MKLRRFQNFQFATLLFMLAFISPVIECKGQSNSPQDSLAAKITFDNDTVNYGTIFHNSNPYRIVKVYNTGKEPLLIENIVGDVVRVVKYSKEPILPGQFSEIAIMYPISRIGPFINFMAITSNTRPDPKIIFVKGNVLPGEENTSKK